MRWLSGAGRQLADVPAPPLGLGALLLGGQPTNQRRQAFAEHSRAGDAERARRSRDPQRALGMRDRRPGRQRSQCLREPSRGLLTVPIQRQRAGEPHRGATVVALLGDGDQVRWLVVA
jgi:hypothetical protein